MTATAVERDQRAPSATIHCEVGDEVPVVFTADTDLSGYTFTASFAATYNGDPVLLEVDDSQAAEGTLSIILPSAVQGVLKIRQVSGTGDDQRRRTLLRLVIDARD